MFSDVKAVIFDLDGTLYNFKWLPIRLIWALPNDLFRIKADRDVRKKLKGSDFGTPEAYKEEYSKKMSKLLNCKKHEALNWYSNRYMGTMCFLLNRYYSCRPRLAEVFSELHKKGIKIAVFSDYPRVKQRIRALDFSDETISQISGIYSAEDFGSQKPAIRPFLEIAKQLEVKPENCVPIYRTESGMVTFFTELPENILGRDVTSTKTTCSTDEDANGETLLEYEL